MRAFARVLVAGLAASVLFAVAASAGGESSDSQPAAGEPVQASAELVERRTASSRTFRRSDGSLMTRVWQRPVNVRDASGGWTPIDHTLSDDGSGLLRNRAGEYAVEIPTDAADGAVRVQRGARWASFKLRNATGTARVAGAKATFADVMPGVAAEYEVTGSGIKETLTLRDASAASEFVFDIAASEGLEPRLVKRGAVEFTDASGTSHLEFGAPFAADAAGKTTRQVAYALLKTAAGWRLTMSVDRGWLQDQKRTFPVAVDPLTYGSPDRECELASGSSADTNFCDGYLRLGVDSVKHRAVFHFDTDALDLDDATVTAARLQLWFESQTGTTETAIDVHRLSADFTSGVTWNKRDGTNSWTAGGTHDAQVETRQPVKSHWEDGWTAFGVSRLVQGWLDGSIENQGVLLKVAGTEASTTNVMTFRDSTASTERPVLEIEHKPRTGRVAGYSFDSHQLADRSSLSVNLANGNLLVESQDVNVAGRGIDFAITRTYNSLLPRFYGHAGDGWQVTPGTDVRLEETWWDKSQLLNTGSGQWFRFDRVPDTGTGHLSTYRTPAGIRATLTKESNGTFTLKFNETDGKWIFNTSGYLEEIRDRHDNVIEFNHTGGSDPMRAIDTHGRRQAWAETTEGDLDAYTDSASRVYDYTQNSGDQLTSYVDPAGSTWGYAYNSTGLSEITDPRGNKTTVAYYTSGTYDDRVSSVTRVGDPSTTADDLVTTYAYAVPDSNCSNLTSTNRALKPIGMTTLTDPRSKVTRYCWNAAGQVVEAKNALGLKTSNKYSPNGDGTEFSDLAGTANAGLSTVSYDLSGSSPTFNVTGGSAPTGEAWSATYDAGVTGSAYRPRTFTSEQGKSQTFGYHTSADGDLASVKDNESPTVNQSTLAYTNATDGGHPNTTVPVTRGLLKTATDGNSNTTSFKYYDTEPNKGSLYEIDPPGTALGTTVFEYDALSRVTKVTDGKSQWRCLFYDNADRVKRVVFSTGLYFDNTYDANGNLTARDRGTGTSCSATGGTFAETTSHVYDRFNRRTQETFPGSVVNDYGYSKSGELTSFADAGGTVTYAYDDIDRVTSVTEPGSSTTSISYDDTTTSTPRRQTIDWPNAMRYRTDFDNAGKVTKISLLNDSGGSAVRERTYNYDDPITSTAKRGLIQSVTDQAGDTTAYTYGPVDQLIKARVTNGGTLVKEWNWPLADWDGALNRKRRDVTTSGGTTTTTYKYNEANQLCWMVTGTSSNTCGTTPTGGTGFTYDANGNQLTRTGGSSFTWDVADRLSAYGSTSLSFLSPTQGELTGIGTDTYRNGMMGLMRQTVGSTSTSYTRLPDGRPLSQRTSNAKQYFAADHLGSTIALVDSSTGTVGRSYSYDPDGSDIESGTGTSTDIRYAAGHLALTGTPRLYHFGARWYDPNTGRWTQQDPVDSWSDLRQANHYLYAGADPINNADPSGELLPFLGAVALSAAVRIGGPRVATYAGASLAGSRAGSAIGTSIARNSTSGVGSRLWGSGGVFNRGANRIGGSHASGRYGVAIRSGDPGNVHWWLYRR